MSYSEAIHYLANRYGVAIDTLPEDQEKKSKQQDALNALEDATQYYQSLLKKSAGTFCREYLKTWFLSADN